MANNVDPYYFSLCRIEQEAAHEISFLSSNSLKLDALMQAMSYDKISANDYLKLLKMNYAKYDKMDRTKEKRYCLVKMQMVADAKVHRYKRNQFKMVNFSNPIRDEFLPLFEQRIKALRWMEESKIKKFLVIDVCIYILVLLAFVYGLHISILFSVAIGLFIFFGTYLLFYYRILDQLVVDELEKDLDLLDPLFQEVEVSRKSSTRMSLFSKMKK
ncbi:hypothetical protein C815_00716 [Firmicutes bacterium M10-2]|nr:hypothetical protein C815_00716 [Firmicutes bacterium M10-2]